MKPLLLLAALPALLSLTAHAAPQLRCHTRYNGESQAHLIAPVASPYGVEGVTLGERFVFRVVFQNTPADIAAVLNGLAQADISIGARFAEVGDYEVRGPRRWAPRWRGA